MKRAPTKQELTDYKSASLLGARASRVLCVRACLSDPLNRTDAGFPFNVSLQYKTRLQQAFLISYSPPPTRPSMAAATEQEAGAAARHRLAQANTAPSVLTQQLADARVRLATRQHLDRLVNQRPSEEQPDADYARKLLERANQLRQEVDARTRNRVVATAVVNAYVRLLSRIALFVKGSPANLHLNRIDQQVLITNHLATTAHGQR